MSLITKIKKKYLLKKSPVAYFRSVGVQIGSGCEIYSSVSFGSEPYIIKIGNWVRINAGVQFVTHDGGVWVLRNMMPECQDVDLIKGITVGNNVHIGTNAIIMPGVNIGNNCIIGCGAIVTRDIPDNSVAVGIPARVIESIEEYYEKNKGKFILTKHMTAEEKKQFLLEYLSED